MEGILRAASRCLANFVMPLTREQLEVSPPDLEGFDPAERTTEENDRTHRIPAQSIVPKGTHRS